MKSIKRFLALLVMIAMCISSFAFDRGYFIGDGGSGKRVLVYTSKVENGKSSDEWISQKVKRDFISDFVNYSNIDVIDSDEKATVIKLQKDSENAYYSDENPIELGKAIQAKSYIKLVCTKKGNTFSLAATITNIETGRTEGSFTSAFYSESDFVTKAHGEASANLLETLGVKLTVAGKRLLQYGSLSASVEDATENLETYKAEIARLEKEQAELVKNRNTDVDKEAENARIEVQKATLLQQQKNEEERLTRLREDEKRKAEEEQLSKERSEESQRKIIALTKEIEEKASKIRQQKVDNMTLLQMIDVIEGEKQVLATNEKIIESNIVAFNEEQDRLCKNEIIERASQKARKNEMNTDGSLNDVGRKVLESDLEAIKQKYATIKTNNEQQLRSSSKQSQESLRSKILSDIKSLESKTFTTDSIQGSDIYFRVENYDGSAKVQGWHYSLSFIFNGKTIFSKNDVLTYKEITGKNVPEYPSANDKNREAKIKEYNEYQDNVEVYDSFFRMNVPYIRAVLKYSVKANDKKKASEYIVSIENVTFINVYDNAKIKAVSLNSNSIFDYNTNTLQEIARVKQEKKDEKTRIKQEKKDEKTRIRQEKKDEKTRIRQAKKEAKAEKLSNFFDSLSEQDGLGGLGFVSGAWNRKFVCTADIYFSPTGWLFFDISTPIGSNIINLELDDGYELSDGFSYGIFAGIGVNKNFEIFSLDSAIYYNFDVGYLNTEFDETEIGTKAFAHTIGITIPFAPTTIWHIDMKYTMYQPISYDINNIHSFSIGVRLEGDDGSLNFCEDPYSYNWKISL